MNVLITGTSGGIGFAVAKHLAGKGIHVYACDIAGRDFGDDNITFRIEEKIFMCLWLGEDVDTTRDRSRKFACKLPPERNEELRERYETIVPAFHWNKKHWSDVYFEQIETEVVMTWIRESYQLIVSKLPKAARAKYQM